MVFKYYSYYGYLQIESCAFLISGIMLIVGDKVNQNARLKKI